MHRRTRPWVMLAVGVAGAYFLVVWLSSPRLDQTSFLYRTMGASSVVVVAAMYLTPIALCVGVIWMLVASARPHSRLLVARSLDLSGSDLTYESVQREAGTVETQTRAVQTWRFTCPHCLGNISFNPELLPVRCEMTELHVWPTIGEFAADLREAGYEDEAERVSGLAR